MLTKDDLKSIKDIVLENNEKLASDILNEVRPEFNSIKKGIKKIKGDQRLIVNFFDSEYLTLRARVERIESTLNIKPLQSF
ncbi:hypothetical protein COT69_00430 [candidate division WWE3 bacterium CG09_land_8_20_14_0_10_39_24]|uniref:Uncharacterized protein n=1 Tax=candidate division WWE3 bacterium CG09_land_8_20_14_0_10_39_24 TaxID=1975088 RepID=A0A2H0WKA7_UNCKA|nr:MAG: hypothetical protein AUJ94_02645 [bacterium CG2_30_40_12]OJI09499.1 MAG: hypothetical protein BK003_00420 [bacterium CG09_39_24]PIS13113.1 MAG: hypothetical protein COT69_00430 [candidate division WWE3 bacterium CG09_land_8_20_14_0_10_39_24]